MQQQLISSLRILSKYRFYTTISVLGLSISFACVLFIGNYTGNMYAYDQFHKNASSIYRVTMEIEAGGATSHYATTGKPVGVLLTESYSGVNSYARLAFQDGTIEVGDEVFKERSIYRTNPEVLDVFNFDIVDGSWEFVHQNEKGLVVSRSIAEKYFQGESALGKRLKLGGERFIVNAVFEDWPENSHMSINALVIDKRNDSSFEGQDWFDLDQYHYVLLDVGKSKDDLVNHLELLVAQDLDPILEGSGIDVRFQTQPIQDVYFGEALIDDLGKGNPVYVKGLIWAGFLIFFIGGLNHINLTLTRSNQRAKEITLKKVLGMSRWQQLKEGAIESLILSLFVLIATLLLLIIGANYYEGQSGYSIWGLEGSWIITIMGFGVIWVLGMVGSGRARLHFSLSGKVLGGGNVKGKKFKYGILVVQLMMSSVLLVTSVGFEKQIDFISNKDMGFSQEHISIMALPDSEELTGSKEQVSARIQGISGVVNTSMIGGGSLPGEENGKELFEVNIDGNREERIFNFYRIDESYMDLLEITFAAGRNFDPLKTSDVTESVVINERLARDMNWNDPIGEVLWYGDVPRKVIGVVEDFHNKSLHHLIEPIVFLFDKQYATNLLIKSRDVKPATLRSIWNDFFPNEVYTLTYFDQFIQSFYQQEQQMKRLIQLFGTVALLLSFVGVFSVFSLHAYQRTKEIGIRKVLGASFLKIWNTMTRRYFRIVLIAMLMAAPLSWYILNWWLQGFSYKVNLGIEIFFWPTMTVLIICTMALSYHTVLVANSNPVESLKEE